MSIFVNTLRPRQNGRHFPDEIFKGFSWMKMNEFRLRFHWNLFLRFSLTIFQHWFRPMMVSLLTYFCVARPQLVKGYHLSVMPWLPLCLVCRNTKQCANSPQHSWYIVDKYSLLMHCIKIKSRAKSLLNEQYVFVGGNISFLCVLSCISEEA